jgi:hypothetical protein
MDALGDRLYIVFDVEVEINRHKDDPEFREGAYRFLELLEHDAIVLPDEIRDKVRRALELTRKLGMRDEDLGETATVLYARSRISVGEDWLVLVGDKYGISLADSGDPPVPHMNTTDVIVDLVDQGALSEAQGRSVWEAVHGPGSGQGLDDKLAERGR